jgi:alkanesulfonate monooxygenase SsuD/methylene tetrahydromethanopterin reductase-like flavin-dependent oxidoreductase (luciferase family)
MQGEYFSCHAAMGPAVSPVVDLGLGVLRPGMARLAGEVADVAITWLTPATYLRDTILPALQEGASEAGRPTPRLSAIVPVALSRNDRDPTETVIASNSAHMQAPHYIEMLRMAGIDIQGAELPSGAQRMIEGRAFIQGDIDRIVEQLVEYEEAGTDEIILNLTGVFNIDGPQAVMKDLKTILAAVA